MERDTWYANCMATDPAYQRRGLASAIIGRVLTDAAATQTVVALGTQSEKNVSVSTGLPLFVLAQAKRCAVGRVLSESWVCRARPAGRPNAMGYLYRKYIHARLSRDWYAATETRTEGPDSDANRCGSYVATSL